MGADGEVDLAGRAAGRRCGTRLGGRDIQLRKGQGWFLFAHEADVMSIRAQGVSRWIAGEGLIECSMGTPNRKESRAMARG